MNNKELKRYNFIQIAGFMIKDLELKGNELLIYGIIFGFCQNGGKCVYSLSYFQNWTNASKQTVLNTLNSLEEKKYIFKTNFVDSNNQNRCEYSLNIDLLNEIEGSQKDLLGLSKILTTGSQKIRHNNINNNIDNKENIKEQSLSLEVIPEKWERVIQQWKIYRKEKKKPLKETSLLMVYKKLLKLSNNDIDLAQKIIEQSIERGWQGLFALSKENATEVKKTTNNNEDLIFKMYGRKL